MLTRQRKHHPVHPKRQLVHNDNPDPNRNPKHRAKYRQRDLVAPKMPTVKPTQQRTPSNPYHKPNVVPPTHRPSTARRDRRGRPRHRERPLSYAIEHLHGSPKRMATDIGSNFVDAIIESHGVLGLSEEEPSLHQRAGRPSDRRSNRENGRSGTAHRRSSRRTCSTSYIRPTWS
jgi:hypothetical protein